MLFTGPQRKGCLHMLKSRLIRPETAELHFEVMAFLIQNHGLPPRPQPPIFRHMSKGFETLAWTDQDSRSVFDWADDNFGTIVTACHMDTFDLCLVANDRALDEHKIAAQRRLDIFTSGQNPYMRVTTTPVLYDPRDCSEPGHYAATLMFQLGELRAAGFKSKRPLSPLTQRMVTLIACAYNSQGFVLAHRLRQVSAYLTPDDYRRAVPQKIGDHALCFATCLALRVGGETEAQIIENYGALMTKSVRRQIHKACRQINANREWLSVLQNLKGPDISQTAPRHRAKVFA